MPSSQECNVNKQILKDGFFFYSYAIGHLASEEHQNFPSSETGEGLWDTIRFSSCGAFDFRRKVEFSVG